MNNLLNGMFWCSGVILMGILAVMVIVGIAMTIRFINSWLIKRGW